MVIMQELLKNLGLETLDKGVIKDTKGNVLGEHNGIINYTVGQRKDIGDYSKRSLLCYQN